MAGGGHGPGGELLRPWVVGEDPQHVAWPGADDLDGVHPAPRISAAVAPSNSAASSRGRSQRSWSTVIGSAWAPRGRQEGGHGVSVDGLGAEDADGRGG